ncbi:STAS domain-containing protein [Streptomyces sp. SPB162]|uniref:STAS domain-containing protein n=1 Tax=Streptomyces sp. SPB162 TaxID=2940560 RepID=UPI0024065EED|nr:STAS domain-containing protein [Streptomyces sp. SPB162]MDF9810777.1 anti-sigma B factor antagonist [Streptomyces sp. SPB162]
MESLQVRPIGPDRDDVVVLAVSGELDYATEQALGDAVARAMGDHCRRLVLECAGVTFCDSQGLNRFLQLRLDLESRGIDLILTGISASLRAVLDLTGAIEVFLLTDTVEDALRAS